MFHQNNIVLIGNSLVEQSKSAAQLNKRVINIDSFNDEDLIGENYKNSCEFGLVNNEVISILKNLELNKDDTVIIVSSDYETEGSYYKKLQSFGKIIGNSHETILKLQDHKNIFSYLQKNNINFPELLNPSNNNSEKSLIKNTKMSGGLGVKKNKNNYKFNTNEYCQKFIDGQVYSILFIANKNKKYEIIGINKIFSKKTVFSDFCFSGAVSNIKLSSNQMSYLNNMINLIINEYNLVGINGIDFIISNEIYFLEINPRITQTCFLYEDFFNNGFVSSHINSYLNDCVHIDNKSTEFVSCFENFYANISFEINFDLKKFNFVSNIPKVKNHFDTGDPVCTINAKSIDEKKAKKILLDNISLVRNELTNIEII